MTTELDQALLTGDAASIDEALASVEIDESLLFGAEDEESEYPDQSQTVETHEDSDLPDVIDTTGDHKPAAEQEDVSSDANAKGSDDPQSDVNADLVSDGVREIDGQLYIPVDPSKAEVIGKNGKHSIPYAVLEAARSDASGYKSKFTETQQELEKVRSDAQRVSLLEKQLEEAGITPEKLPDELLNDPEAIQSIQDEIGGNAGKVIAEVIKQFAQAKGASSQQDVSQEEDARNVVGEALSAPEVAELNSWQSEDPDRWQMALIIDNKLRSDPDFQSVSMPERFAEVQRRVKASFGDPVEASIQKQLEQEEKPSQQPEQPNNPKPAAQQASEQTQIPNSPSSLGGTTTDTQQAAYSALASQDPMALEQSLATMPPEEVEAFLASAAIALD